MVSPVHGDLPIALIGNRHPVQTSGVVRRIDATKHDHAATLVIAVGSVGAGRETGILSFMLCITAVYSPGSH